MPNRKTIKLSEKVKLIYENCDKQCVTCPLFCFKDCKNAAKDVQDILDVQIQYES